MVASFQVQRLRGLLSQVSAARGARETIDNISANEER